MNHIGRYFTAALLTLLLQQTTCYGQWSAQLQGGPGSFLSIHFADANNGYVTGSRFQFSKTNNGGTRWVAQNDNGGPEELTSVVMTSPNDIYIVFKALGIGNLDRLFISRDAGANFIPTQTGLFQTVHFQSPSIGFLAGQGGTMIKTVDAGRQWEPINTGTTQFIRDVFFVDSQLGFIVGDNGMLRRTTNGGINWQAVNAGSSANLKAIYFTSTTTGYCIGANGTALRTQNGGTTWSSMAIGTSNTLHDVIFTSALTGCIVGSFGAILVTTDGGTTWRAEESNTAEGLNALAAIPNGRLWAAGDNGTVLVRAPISIATGALAKLPAATYQLYPNPVTDRVTIDLGQKNIEPLDIVLTDVTGRAMIEAPRTRGSCISLSTAKLPPGIYIVRVSSASGVWIRKVLKTS